MKTQILLLAVCSFFHIAQAQLTLQDSLVAHYPLDGNALDISGNANHGSLQGAVLVADRYGNPNAAMQFDGFNDYVELSANQKFKPQLPVSISAWIQLHDYNLNMVFRNDFEENFYHGVWMNSSGGIISAGFGDGNAVSPTSRRSKRGTSVLPQFQWTHVTVVIRGAQDMDIYINGKNDCGIYTGSGGNLAYSSSNGDLGRSDDFASPGPLNFFNGQIDDVRFYNRALGPEEVEKLSEITVKRSYSICGGTSANIDAGAANSYSWSPSTGLSCTTCRTPIANPTVSTEYQVIRSISNACPDTFSVEVNVLNCQSNPCDSSFSLTDSLVAHYPVNGNFLDASGFGNDGTATGAVLTTDRFGNPNEAYFLDGVDDFISLQANHPKFKPALPVTIAAWVEIRDYDLNNVFQNDFILGTYHGPWMNIVNGKVSAHFGDGGPTGPNWRRSKTGTTTLNLNQWYHVAVVIRGSFDMDIFINGVNDCGTYSGSGGPMAYSLVDGMLGVGTSRNDLYLHGKIDDVRLYNRELCIYEIRELAEYSNYTILNFCTGDTASLNVDNGSSTYSWSPAQDLSCSNCSNPQAYPSDTTLYQVIRDNGFNCRDTLSFELTPEVCQFIPPCDTTTLQANFDYTSNGLVFTGMDASIGPDSGIDRWRWDFGDGNRRSVFQTDTVDHQYFLPGSYNVCLTIEKFYDELNVCFDTFCQLVMVDSLASSYGQELSPFGWQLYPNPAKRSIMLAHADYQGEIQLKVYNLRGKELDIQENFFEAKLEIDIQNLASGLYILEIKNKEKTGFLKFVKE
ncbi:MAG: LamG-like jellyroll fold domain-containing protein [Bacteroidia bacterium]|nr:LamG-like jellyroll fold domain-containing protein [Bacteroidia bacterium]